MDSESTIQGAHVEWANQTALHPLGLAALVCLGIATLVLPRRLAVWPFIIMACFIAPAQRVVIAELDFSLLRLLVLFGVLRVLTKGEYRGLRWGPMDTVLVAWAVVGTAAYTALHGTLGALIMKCGECYDALGMYFVFRSLMRSWGDLEGAISGFVWVSIPVVIFFAIENATGRNLFAFLGGVPEITLVRDGRMRCQGAFSHPILAGCFWASLVPLIAARWWGDSQRDRALAVLGLITSLMLVWLSASSTPVMGVLFAILGAVMFKLRHRMRAVLWGVTGTLAVLHVAMSKPVWHLAARLDVVSGSTGWHRYHLIDEAINRIGEWGLIGTKGTGHWGWALADITNNFLLQGVQGGLATMVLFIVFIGLGFGAVGRMWRAARQDRRRVALAWALGISLFVHCMNFMAVAYFGQITMLWYFLLATIASLAPPRRAAATAPAARRAAAGRRRPAPRLQAEPLLPPMEPKERGPFVWQNLS